MNESQQTKTIFINNNNIYTWQLYGYGYGRKYLDEYSGYVSKESNSDENKDIKNEYSSLKNSIYKFRDNLKSRLIKIKRKDT